MECQTNFIHDPLNNNLPHLEKECGIFMNNNVWYLCRADIPMDDLMDINKANDYANLIVKMMYSPMEENKRKNHYSAFSFVMAMQAAETFYLFFYKFKYFDSMKKRWLVHLSPCQPIVNAEVLLWPSAYHNLDGVNLFDSRRGYACYHFYETMDELIAFFSLLDVEACGMEKNMEKKLKQKMKF